MQVSSLQDRPPYKKLLNASDMETGAHDSTESEGTINLIDTHKRIGRST